MSILIIGGTGTLGKELTVQLLAKTASPITIFSRDEHKQNEHKKSFNSNRIDYVLGDIRDPDSLVGLFKGREIVFHVAALKHVDIMENNIEECIKTNLLGTLNVAKQAMIEGTKYVVFSSTDKAVLPVNVYGACKFISERYFHYLNRKQRNCRFSVFRWGNVVGSTGSAIPYFIESLKAGKPVNITDRRMTRFFVRIQDAVNFMLENYTKTGETKVPEMKAIRMTELISYLAKSLGIKHYQENIIGIRAGEKLHECIHSSHEFCARSDNGPQYSEEELEPLLKDLL